MKKRICKALLFFLALQLPGVPRSPLRADSWEDEKQVWEQMSKAKNYKDPGYAAKLSLNFLPVDNGHFYVEEVGKGIWYSVGETGSLVAVAVPLLGSQSRSRKGFSPVWTDGMVISASAGGLFYVLLKVMSAYDAADGARRFNKVHEEARAKEKQGFRLDLSPRGVSLTKAW